MRNLTINTVVTVEAEFTMHDWELYTSMEASNAVASALNRRLEKEVSKASLETSCRVERIAMVRREMHQLMSQYRSYGALDTEPVNFLERVLEEIFP